MTDYERVLAAAVDSAAGAEYVCARVMSVRTGSMNLHDGLVESLGESRSLGLGVRVLVDGCWGFASSDVVSVDEAARLARAAVGLARISAPLVTQKASLAPEPVHVGAWASPYDVDPFAIPPAERRQLLEDRSRRLLSDPRVAHSDASVVMVREDVWLADNHGSRLQQTRHRIESSLDVTVINDATGDFEVVSTTAPPAGRGWEYVVGEGESVRGARAWDWDTELDELPERAVEKLHAPSVRPGTYTLVIDPTNLWLTIHESIGHATELDRAIGYEANYAGSSFATPDLLGSLQYGSELMHVTGDRTAEFGLSTVGWDDEAVAAQEWDLVRGGVLVGYQLDRAMAAEYGYARSNGCAYADSAEHVPIQRMPNVSLQPDPTGPNLAGLIGGVDDGLLIVGDNSWSIDMQRFNFQFTGQHFYRIRSGRVEGQVRDVAYQSRTPDFWGSLVALGGPETYLLGGALNCGKGQPGQVAAVSHGCPAAVFDGVRVLNTRQEAP